MRSLKGKLAFQTVFQQGLWASRRRSPIRAKIVPSLNSKESDECVLGIIASRKVGNAVQRNKAKRQTREILRSLEKHNGLKGLIVIVLSHEYCQFEFQEKKSRLQSIFKNFMDQSGRDLADK